MNKTNTASGVTGVELLQIAFIVLKLLHKVDWSWWWVLAPTWGIVALVIAFLVIGLVAVTIGTLLKRVRDE